jgi:hypothetical protein
VIVLIGIVLWQNARFLRADCVSGDKGRKHTGEKGKTPDAEVYCIGMVHHDWHSLSLERFAALSPIIKRGAKNGGKTLPSLLRNFRGTERK